MTGRSFHKTILMRALLASLMLACGWTAPARAAEILTIEFEAVFESLPSSFEGDEPGSVDLEPGATITFSAKLTDLEETTSSGFWFTPTILDASGTINGAPFTFENLDASPSDAFLGFNILGGEGFLDETTYEFTGSTPTVEGHLFTELIFWGSVASEEPLTSISQLIPFLDTSSARIILCESFSVPAPYRLRLTNCLGLSAAVTSFNYTVTDPEVVPLPAAFPLMAGGLALFGGAGFARRRRRGR